MSEFIGRKEQLASLNRMLERVRTGSQPGGRPGKALLMRGRRRVGKSRLVEEFIERAGVPSLFFTASRRGTADELRLFAEEAASSDLPGAALFQQVDLRDWDAALRLLAAALPTDRPSIVVLDELPYLIEDEPSFEGTLQKLYDRELSRKPVLLIGVGSDLAMMESLGTYGRPFHQRATEMVIPPLSPYEVGQMVGLTDAEAFDAYLITGGLPLLCAEWEPGCPLWDYLADAVSDPTSALLVSGERSLAAEFPADLQARTVLTAIGNGERTFTNISRLTGLPMSTLHRVLKPLIDKRVVAVDIPLSTRPSKDTRYRIADPHLRFWLPFLGPFITEIERGRSDKVLARIRAGWPSWRGRAIEPVVRESLSRLPEESLPPGCGVFGGYWTRTNDPEIDIVAADRAPIAKRIAAAGSIKWLENSAFDSHDLGSLAAQCARLPGASPDTALIAVSRSGFATDGVRRYGPAELMAAWA